MAEDIVQPTEEAIPVVRTFTTTAIDLVIASPYGTVEFIDGRFETSDASMADEILPCEGVVEVTE